jgi:hypothetical protein
MTIIGGEQDPNEPGDPAEETEGGTEAGYDSEPESAGDDGSSESTDPTSETIPDGTPDETSVPDPDAPTTDAAD